MGGMLSTIKTWWDNATNVQRYGTLGGIGVVVLLLVGTFMVASQPRYSLLYGGLSDPERAIIVTEIQAMGIPVKYDQAGAISVPADKVPDINLKLASSGKMPKSGHPGNGDLSAMNLYTTPAVERERLKSIREGELASTLERSPGVQSARVHITLGDPSPFGDQRRPSTASVDIVSASVGNVTRDQARGMAMLVANSVDGLDVKNVNVINEKMEVLFNGADLEGGSSLAERKQEVERQTAKEEERRLQSALDKMFGPNSTLVTVRAEVDLDEESSHSEDTSPKKGVVSQKASETMGMAGGGGTPPTISGIDSQKAPADKGGAAAGQAGKDGGKYVQQVLKMDTGSLRVTKDIKKAPGGIKSMVINVMANVGRFKPEEAEKRSAFETAVREFVTTEIANKQVGEDKDKFIAKVTPTEFDTTIQVKAEAAQKEATSAERMQQVISLLPILALVVVGFMVVKQIGKFSKPAMVTMSTPQGTLVQIPATTYASGSYPAGYLPYTPGQPLNQGAPQLEQVANKETLSNLGIPTNIPPENQLAYALEQQTQDSKHEQGVEFENTDERLRIARIKERTSIPLEQIKQMAKERPEAVALLIKSWMVEERR